MENKESLQLCYFRIFNAFPSHLSLSVYLGEKLYAKEMFYEDFTHYQHLPATSYPFKVTPFKEEESLLEVQVTFQPHRIYTLILFPHPKATNKLQFFCVEDYQRPVTSPDCVARVAHFAHGINAFDFLLAEDKIRFKNISPTEVSRYVPFESILQPLQWIDHSYKTPLVQIEHLFKPIRFYTLYLIGNDTKEFPIKCAVTIDGPSYLPCPLLSRNS